MELPTRVELTFAPAAGIAALVAALAVAIMTGAPHPELRAVLVFVVVFPVLWIGAATMLSFAMARALRLADVDVPVRTRAGGSFKLSLTLSLSGYGFPAIGVMSNARFATTGVAIDAGPWAEMPILEIGRAGMSQWDVLAKKRGLLLVGPFRCAIEL